jgi:hypothetical protein
MAWSGSPKTWVSGAITAAEFNAEIRDRMDWLKAALLTHGIVSDSSVGELAGALYGCRLRRTTDQSVADGVSESIQFTSEDFDSHAFHSTAGNTQRITIPSGGDGYYDIGGGVRVFLEVNGIGGAGTEIPGTQVRVLSAGGAVTTQLTTSTFYELSAGDYVALTVLQNGGGALNVTSATFWAARRFKA